MTAIASSGRVRVAMIGAGSMANHVHYPSLASFADIEIAAICDLDPVRLRETADRYSVAARYSDYRRMVEEVAPDAVYAIGQPHIMYDVWTWCLRRGLNLFVEKPPGITLHQAQALAHLAAENGCITQVGFQRRTSPLAVRLREECLARGAISYAACRFFKPGPTPYLEARDRMLDDGVHAIDTLRWMCGGTVVVIHPVTRRVGAPDVNLIAALLEFDNGATGMLSCHWASGRRIFAVEMHAPGICAEADLESTGRVYADGDTSGTSYDARVVAGSDAPHVYGGFAAKSREFIDAIRGGPPPSSCFADALDTMRVAHRILAHDTLKGA
jgi:predicted dehydrogenase